MTILNKVEVDYPQLIVEFLKSEDLESKVTKYCKGIIQMGGGAYVPIFIDFDSNEFLEHPIMDGNTIYIGSIRFDSVLDALRLDSFKQITTNIRRRFTNKKSLLGYQTKFGAGANPFEFDYMMSFNSVDFKMLHIGFIILSGYDKWNKFNNEFMPKDLDEIIGNQYTKNILTAFSAIKRGCIPKNILSKDAINTYTALEKYLA